MKGERAPNGDHSDGESTGRRAALRDRQTDMGLREGTEVHQGSPQDRKARRDHCLGAEPLVNLRPYRGFAFSTWCADFETRFSPEI